LVLNLRWLKLFLASSFVLLIFPSFTSSAALAQSIVSAPADDSALPEAPQPAQDSMSSPTDNPSASSQAGTASITGTILETLARIDPANAASYAANRAAFLARLQAKLAEWEAKLAPLKAMPLVAYHNSWPYFARRFRLDFAGFIETKPGVPPSPSHLAGIMRTMQARGVRIVVREPHEPKRDVDFVADRAGATVVTLAASVGALPHTEDYISLFDANVEALTSAAAVR